MEATAPSAISENARLYRAMGYFAVFALAWWVTNLTLHSEALSPVPNIAAGLCLVLLIHGGWRVVPVTFIAGTAFVGFAWGLDRLQGVHYGLDDVGNFVAAGACVALPAGAYMLPQTDEQRRVSRLVSQCLWYAGLITSGILASSMVHGIAFDLRKWL